MIQNMYFQLNKWFNKMVFRLLLDINPVNEAEFRVFNQRLIFKQKQLELSLNVTNTPIPALSQEKRSFENFKQRQTLWNPRVRLHKFVLQI